MGELVQFIPRSRRSRDSDFPVIVFKGPVPTTRPGMGQLIADSWVEIAPSEYVAPESDPA